MRQVASGHGQINYELAVKDMMRYHDADFPIGNLVDIMN
jgi:hypothetical protein